jgi:serpin B
VSLLEKDFDAFITTQNFADPATVRAINNWCAEHTSDKILEIIDEISPNDVMILINALYFNAPWQDKFNPENTEDAVFHGKSGDVTVPMMFRRGRYNYIGYQGCKLIEIPYAAGGYSMYILLPPPGMSPDDVIPHITEYALNSAIKLMAPKEVMLRMPKFKLETEMLLNETLQHMGLKSSFSAAADFKGISAMGPLSLSIVKQKCYIDVSERGTEAAAVTSAQVRMTAVRPSEEFTVDRPFIYIIASEEGKNILFAGKTVNL